MNEPLVIKEQTDDKLKAIAYDIILQIQQYQNILAQIQAELAERSKAQEEQ